MTFDANNLIGTFNIIIVPRGTGKKEYAKKIKQYKTKHSGKYKCSGCTVANDDEDAVIEHIMAENECKAQYYRISKDENMPVLS